MHIENCEIFDFRVAPARGIEIALSSGQAVNVGKQKARAINV